MEVTGHYYTVYFTSLAVGFNETIAYRHAVLAQMPDEVGWMDAANVHKRQCFNRRERDLNNIDTVISPDLRSDTEYVLHALPDKLSGSRSAFFQQAATRYLLRKESPLSLEFGLLLHRLGDTYAHAVMGNESVMYAVSSSGSSTECMRWDSLGHARHGHAPDYPFLRLEQFDKYITDLYTILNEKARQREFASYTRKVSPRSQEEVRRIFKKLLTDELELIRSSMWARVSKDRVQAFFIQKIREQSVSYLGVTMKPYAPERIEKQSLPEFLLEVKELNGMDISERSITDAVGFIRHDLNKMAEQQMFRK